MGRIDVVVPDGLEVKLRLKAVHSHGGRRGSLSDAVQTAIEAYVRADEHASLLQKLTETLRDPTASSGVVREAIRTLATIGEDGLLALTALTDVATDPSCPHRDLVEELLPAALRFPRIADSPGTEAPTAGTEVPTPTPEGPAPAPEIPSPAA